MFPLIYGYFRVNWNRYRPSELKENMERGGEGGELPAYGKMSTIMIAWLRKIVTWNHLQWLEVLLTFVWVGDLSFHNNSGFLKNC